jgi:flagellar protein FlaG
MENALISKISVEPRAIRESSVNRPRAESARDVVEAEPAEQTKAQPENVVSAINKINEFIQVIRRDLQFSVDENTGMTVVKVMDSESQEVIRQIPSEEVLAIAANLEEARGLLFKTKA